MALAFIVKLKGSLEFPASVTCFVAAIELFKYSVISCLLSVSLVLITTALIVIFPPTPISPEETVTSLKVKLAGAVDAGSGVVEVDDGVFAGIVAAAVVDTGVDVTGELSVEVVVVEIGCGVITAGVVVVVGNEGLAITVKMVKWLIIAVTVFAVSSTLQSVNATHCLLSTSHQAMYRSFF